MAIPRVRTDLSGPQVHGQAVYAVTNHVDDRAYDANTVLVAELADVVGSIIADLIEQGILSGTVSA